ncbi:hypothetical protein KKH43_01845 [Patescibacteria group bacterium]|nr:hypothetical protein [Patescibacteria group bacterium]
MNKSEKSKNPNSFEKLPRSKRPAEAYDGSQSPEEIGQKSKLESVRQAEEKERKFAIREGLYKDENAPDHVNCFGYVFYKLGLDPEEAGLGSDIEKYLETVQSIEEADAIAFRSLADRTIHHMTYVGPNSTISDKGNVGWSTEKTSFDELRKKYTQDKYETIFLKLKN